MSSKSFQENFWLPQRVLADLCGMTQSNISRADNGNRSLSRRGRDVLTQIHLHMQRILAAEVDLTENYPPVYKTDALLKKLTKSVRTLESQVKKLGHDLSLLKEGYLKLENTRQLILRLESNPDFPLDELEAADLEVYKTKTAQKLKKFNLLKQEDMQNEIDLMNMRLERDRILLNKIRVTA